MICKEYVTHIFTGIYYHIKESIEPVFLKFSIDIQHRQQNKF